MGEILRSLASYENIKLHPTVMRWMCKKMIEECDVYLDINHEFKFPDVLEWVQEERPPFSFSKYLKRKSLETYSLQISIELSGEPSFINKHSKF